MAFDAGVLYNLTPRLDCLLDQHSQWPGYDRCYVIAGYVLKLLVNVATTMCSMVPTMQNGTT